MPEFLELLPPTQALSILLEVLDSPSLPFEWIDSSAALGRICALPVEAPEPSPAFNRSSVDGFAILAQNTYGASDSLPAYLTLVGEIAMGTSPSFILQSGQAALIHTGGMLPGGADAVVMLEHCQYSRPNEIEVLKSIASGDNTIQLGEDVRQGQIIISAGQLIRPAEVGGLTALGIRQVAVRQKPRVAILSTGDEVIPPDQVLKPGQVRDINTYTLKALIERAGGIALLLGIIPDQILALNQALNQAQSLSDMVVITAGSSASARDLTAQAINSAGHPGVLVHGVNVRPGKPTILGVCDHQPVIGLPGNPVSALVIAWLFVVPVIHHLLGRSRVIRPSVQARLTNSVPSETGRDDWFPVRLKPLDEEWIAEPIFYKSNLIFTISRADGLLHIPPSANGLAAGDWVTVFLLE